MSTCAIPVNFTNRDVTVIVNKTILAVDPGASGGLAWKFGASLENCCRAMPKTRVDLINLIREITGALPRMVAYVESGSGYIEGASAASMGKYKANCERPLCILLTLGIRLIEVKPRQWIDGLGLGTKGQMRPPKEANEDQKRSVKNYNALKKRLWKTKLQEKAQQINPGVKVTKSTADALLILEYAIQQERGR